MSSEALFQTFSPEILNKLYIWDGSAWQQAGSANTDELSEGSSNLYYTDARVSTYLTGGTGITESSGTLSIDFSEFDTDSMVEGSTNLYHTAARARVALSGSTGITYDNSTGAISIDGTVVQRPVLITKEILKYKYSSYITHIMVRFH